VLRPKSIHTQIFVLTCHSRQLSTHPKECQLSSRYLARALVGGRFQMLVIGERQVAEGMAGVFQAKRNGYGLDMEGFWLRDKCRIIAVLDTFAQLNPTPNLSMLVHRGDGEGMAS
jgi:hypothetical protein